MKKNEAPGGKYSAPEHYFPKLEEVHTLLRVAERIMYDIEPPYEVGKPSERWINWEKLTTPIEDANRKVMKVLEAWSNEAELKATPKKVYTETREAEFYYADSAVAGKEYQCPTCKAAFPFATLDEWMPDDISYCPNCGQALDWSEALGRKEN